MKFDGEYDEANYIFVRPLQGATRGGRNWGFHKNLRYIASWYSMSWEFEDEYDGHIVFENDVRIFELDVRIFEL